MRETWNKTFMQKSNNEKYKTRAILVNKFNQTVV